MCEQLYLTDDRLLFDKIRGGNAKAFEYAFRKFSPRLGGICPEIHQRYKRGGGYRTGCILEIMGKKGVAG